MSKQIKFYETIVTVEGDGPFPIDMLRYDCCFPDSETMSERIDFLNDQHNRVIELRRRGLNPRLGQHSIGRWRSFGWTVIDERDARL